MLILTRRYSESIIIDGRIVLKVLGINDHIVRLGFDAPRDVVIHRTEIAERIESRASFMPKANNAFNSKSGQYPLF